MNTPNEALSLLAKILINVENFVLSQGNYVDYLRSVNVNSNKLENEETRLIEWINKHDELQNQFSQLLEYLQENQNKNIQFIEQRNRAILNYEHIRLINKDVLFWKDQAKYYKETRHLFYRAYMNIKNGQKDKLN